MQGGGEDAEGAGGVWLFGIILGLAGALLDFYSGYTLLAVPAMGVNEMGVTQGTPGVVWGFGVVALGVVLLVTTLASIASRGARRMGDFGALMTVYGAVMLFVGSFMLLGFTQMMTGAAPTGAGMIAVGVLMGANGVLMRRSPMM